MTSGGYTSQTLNRGDRLRIRIIGDDVGATNQASTFTFNASWNGTSAAADGDTYVTFTENFSFESAPGGSQLFLTNVQSGLSAAPALISDFTGANENPLSEGGNWAKVSSLGNNLQRISNSVAAATSNGRMYWTPANFGPDLEAYLTIGTAVAAQSSNIYARIQGEGGADTWDGYDFQATHGATTSTISSVTNNTVTTLFTGTASSNWASGDKLGVRLEGSTLQFCEAPQWRHELAADLHHRGRDVCVSGEDWTACVQLNPAPGRLLRRHRLQPLHAEGVDITRGGRGVVPLGHGRGLDGTAVHARLVHAGTDSVHAHRDGAGEHPGAGVERLGQRLAAL